MAPDSTLVPGGMGILHATPFGAAVAAAVAARLPGAVAVRRLARAAPPRAADVPPGGVLILVLGHTVPSVERLADDLARARSAALVPVVAEQPYVRVGPVLGPAATATVDCFFRRTGQHGRTTGRRELLAAYDEQWPLDGLGHLPSLVPAAAVLAAGAVRRLLAGEVGDLQHVVTLDGLAPGVIRTRLTGVHGNARSRPPVPEADRSWRLLAGPVREAMGLPDGAAVPAGRTPAGVAR